MNRNSKRIFQKILPYRDHDIHIHTKWSQDNLDGPEMKDYVELAQKYNFQIGFSDHFEFQYYEKDWIEANNMPEWVLNPSTIDKYLEEIDQVRENGYDAIAGLEVDYLVEYEDELQNFIEDYYDQFDVFIGSVHELEPHRPFTIKSHFDWYMKTYKSFKAMLDQYYEKSKRMLELKIFDVIAHPNVMYRFIDPNNPENAETMKIYHEDKMIEELGQLCIDTGTLMEVNLSGIRGTWQQSFPSKEHVYDLYSKNLKFVVGSDSHKLQDFNDSILEIRKYNNYLRARTI